MDITNFSQYIEDLCRRHIDVKHEVDGVHFVDSEGEKDTSLDNVLCYPAVILSKGSYHYTGDTVRYGKDYEYMLFVLDHVSDTGDYKQIQQKTEKCELIVDELFNQFIEDKRSRKYPFLTGFVLSGIDVDPVENKDNSLYGYLAMFSLEKSYKPINCRKAFIE